MWCHHRLTYVVSPHRGRVDDHHQARRPDPRQDPPRRARNRDPPHPARRQPRQHLPRARHPLARSRRAAVLNPAVQAGNRPGPRRHARDPTPRPGRQVGQPRAHRSRGRADQRPHRRMDQGPAGRTGRRAGQDRQGSPRRRARRRDMDRHRRVRAPRRNRGHRAARRRVSGHSARALKPLLPRRRLLLRCRRGRRNGLLHRGP